MSDKPVITLDRENKDILRMVRPKGDRGAHILIPLDETFDHLSDEEILERFDVVDIYVSED